MDYRSQIRQEYEGLRRGIGNLLRIVLIPFIINSTTIPIVYSGTERIDSPLKQSKKIGERTETIEATVLEDSVEWREATPEDIAKRSILEILLSMGDVAGDAIKHFRENKDSDDYEGHIRTTTDKPKELPYHVIIFEGSDGEIYQVSDKCYFKEKAEEKERETKEGDKFFLSISYPGKEGDKGKVLSFIRKNKK